MPPPGLAGLKLDAEAGAKPTGVLPHPLTRFLNSAGLSLQASRKTILVFDPMLLIKSSTFSPAKLNVGFSVRNININREKIVVAIQLCAVSCIEDHGNVRFT
jgi:hypothetical protein